MIGIATLLGGVAGLVLGSFAATAAQRYACGRDFVSGRSSCDTCAAPLTFATTIPVVSYVWFRGRCADCGGRIDPAHPIGELTGAMVVSFSVAFASPLSAALLSLTGIVLLASSVIDSRTQRLPDVLTAVVAGLGALLALSRDLDALVSGTLIAITSAALVQGLRIWAGRFGRDPGLGFGDVKLIAALAIWLGPLTPIAVAVAAVAGLVGMVVFRPTDGRLPFGPFLAAAGWVAGFGHEISAW